MEDEFDGDEIARLIRREGGCTIAEALTGCGFYRDDPERLTVILGCDAARATVSIASTGAPRTVALAGGYVVSADGRLGAAIAGMTTAADRDEAARRRAVAAFGIGGRVEDGDLPVLAEAIAALNDAALPPEPARAEAMWLARKYGSARTVLKFTDAWRTRAAGPIPADILIQHVACLRELGHVDDALIATDVVTGRGHGLAPGALSVLMTQRAALWLDRFELRGEAALLARAREAANRSWAIGPSDECGLVYQRLKMLERGDRR